MNCFKGLWWFWDPHLFHTVRHRAFPAGTPLVRAAAAVNTRGVSALLGALWRTSIRAELIC